ncbi:MAG: four helix bundle protein [Bacteroidales bacterium]
MAFFRFQDLRVYQRILEFARLADAQVHKEPGYDGVEIFPRLSEAALRAAMKIAEGASMPREVFIVQVRDAKTHIRECVVLLDYANTKGIISKANYSQLMNELEEITKMLGALRTSLGRTNTSTNGDTQEEKDWDV